jgi:channel protein (hemolysin III family)
MFCNFFSYGISYIYHVYSYKYGPDIENLIIKLDRSGIFLNVSGNFTPVSILFMKKTGIYLCGSQWLFSFVGIYRIFFLNRTIWWEPLGVGAIAILFIPEMWEVMTPFEFWMTMSSYVFSVIGGIFTYYKIDLYVKPHIWGYHENFHFCVAVAGIIVYFINYSLSCRYLTFFNPFLPH